MKNLAPDNPFVTDIHTLEHQIATSLAVIADHRDIVRESEKQLKILQTKAAKYERKDLKSIGQDLLQMTEVQNWKDQVHGDISQSGRYHEILPSGYTVEFTVEKYIPKYLDDDWLRWKCILRDPQNNVKKITSCKGHYRWTNIEDALKLFYPDMQAWANRMAKRG